MGYLKVERPSVPLISKVTLSKEFRKLLFATLDRVSWIWLQVFGTIPDSLEQCCFITTIFLL